MGGLHTRRFSRTSVGAGFKPPLRTNPIDGALTKARELEGAHSIVLGVGGGIRRRPEAAVVSDEVFFRDPAGTAAESSNSYPDALSVQRIGDFLERSHTDAMNLCRYCVLDRRRRFTHQDYAWLVSRLNRSLCHQEKGRSLSWRRRCRGCLCRAAWPSSILLRSHAMLAQSKGWHAPLSTTCASRTGDTGA